MDPVQITPQASQDIAKLEGGVDKVKVALDALRESNLSPNQKQQLEAILKQVSPTDGAASATKSEVVVEFKIVGYHQAMVGKMTRNGQQLDTLLSEGSFNKTRAAQIAYAGSLGYKLATCEEHLAYVEGLLAKEGHGTINDPEKNALNTYRTRYVRHTDGGLLVVGRRVWEHNSGHSWHDKAHHRAGALFVRAAA